MRKPQSLSICKQGCYRRLSDNDGTLGRYFASRAAHLGLVYSSSAHSFGNLSSETQKTNVISVLLKINYCSCPAQNVIKVWVKMTPALIEAVHWHLHTFPNNLDAKSRRKRQCKNEYESHFSIFSLSQSNSQIMSIGRY